jgi:hypothetical protein
MTLVLLVVLIELWLLLLARGSDWRSALVTAALVWSILLLTVSEALSAAQALARLPLFCLWAAIAVALLWPLRRGWRQIRERVENFRQLTWSLDTMSACLLISLGITLVIALVAPPNTVDSMTYHLGRVTGWLAQRSLAHFATHVERQVALSPFAEIVVANLQAISGGDRLANLVQWAAFGLCCLAASLLVRDMGGDERAQKLAALIVVTTPMSILQASSTQNDLVCAFFVTTAVLHCLSIKDALGSGFGLGMATGLAMLTKGTAPVYLAPFAIWATVRLAGLRRPGRALVVAGLAVAVALTVNTPQWLRNQQVYGSPLGPKWIAQLVGNQAHGLGTAYSNLVRNCVSHVGIPTARMGKTVLAAVTFAHQIVGLDANDPRTTGFGEYSTTPLNTHEDAAPNTVHLLLFLVAGVTIFWRGRARQRWLWLVVAAGLVLYGAAFKWQPWGNRLHTPFFVLAAVPTALALQLVVFRRLQKVVALALIVAAAPWLLANDTRSIVPALVIPWMRRATDVWTKSRIEQYFANSPEDYARFATLGERLHASGCATVGVLGDEAGWTYPLHLFLEQASPESSSRPVLVQNPTAALERPGPEPCAMVSLAFGRIREPDSTSRFRITWHDGPLALYLPGSRAEP